MNYSKLACLAMLCSLPLAAQKLRNTFFVFDNGLARESWSLDRQADFAKSVGFDGIAFNDARLVPERLKAMDDRGMNLVALYVWVKIRDGQTEYEPGLEQSIRQLKGRDTLVWLTIQGNGVDAELRAADAAGTVADWAAASGLRVALYPHFGYYVARVEDALRIEEKAKRPNLGVTFNLCHWLRVGDEPNLKLRLREAMPRLWAVSINGADRGTDTWEHLIQPLGRGDFDVENLLRELIALGYKGPIGLQCYNIPGDPEDNLRGSMTVWRRLSSRVAAGAGH